MIVVCQSCSVRIQIDDAKAPPGSFSIRCPKCGTTVNAGPASPASQKSALSVGGSPSTDHPRYERPNPAPAFELNGASHTPEPKLSSNLELARALAEILNQSRQDGDMGPRDRLSWSRRQVLVCAADSRREPIARLLSANGYQVFVAQDTRQAVERMRENRLEVVLLDPEFDAAEQGAAFVTREVNILRPAQRRRLFFGLLSHSLRTLDAHSAFLNNANLTVNINDLEELPVVLDRAMREFNELYTDFNRALNLPAL